MLAGRVLRTSRTTSTTTSRHYATSNALQSVPVLPTPDRETFRTRAFEPATPALLPPQTFRDFPAIRKWFTHLPHHPQQNSLNRSYLSRFGSTTVPLEITHGDQFNRIEQSLSFFLECVHASASSFQPRPTRYFSSFTPGARAVRRTTESNDFFSASALTTPTARLYLAQASLRDLPQGLRDDIPTPELVLKAGKGDIYDSSIWLGQAPTYTPLHRDPNPNLFVQLAGIKQVRLFAPDIGRAIFASVQEKIGSSASATMRGEEMMRGVEKQALEKEVWGGGNGLSSPGYEAELNAGDGIFIPRGWWHSIKGIGNGMTGSVNWWFR